MCVYIYIYIYIHTYTHTHTLADGVGTNRVFTEGCHIALHLAIFVLSAHVLPPFCYTLQHFCHNLIHFATFCHICLLSARILARRLAVRLGEARLRWARPRGRRGALDTCVYIYIYIYIYMYTYIYIYIYICI